MKLQQTSEDGLCLLTSFAMAFDCSATDLQKEMGDSWKSVIFPGLPRPYCWKGHHIQEFVRHIMQYGYAITPVELAPTIGSPLVDDDFYPCSTVPVYASAEAEVNSQRVFSDVIFNSRGVLTGCLASSIGIVRGHAVAYEYGRIFDPRGYVFRYSTKECERRGYYANCAWRIDKVEV